MVVLGGGGISYERGTTAVRSPNVVQVPLDPLIIQLVDVTV